MTAHPIAAANAGLPIETATPFIEPGWHRIWGNSINLPPAGSTRVVWIAELSQDPDWPMPRPWFGVWVTREAAVSADAAIIRGELTTIDALIVERIETEPAS